MIDNLKRRMSLADRAMAALDEELRELPPELEERLYATAREFVEESRGEFRSITMNTLNQLEWRALADALAGRPVAPGLIDALTRLGLIHVAPGGMYGVTPAGEKLWKEIERCSWCGRTVPAPRQGLGTCAVVCAQMDAAATRREIIEAAAAPGTACWIAGCTAPTQPYEKYSAVDGRPLPYASPIVYACAAHVPEGDRAFAYRVVQGVQTAATASASQMLDEPWRVR